MVFRRVAASANKTRVKGDHGYAGGKKHPKEIQKEKDVIAHAHPKAVTDHGYAGTSSSKSAETLEHWSGGGRQQSEDTYIGLSEMSAGAVTDHGYAGTRGGKRTVTITSEMGESGDQAPGDHRYLASGAKRRQLAEAATYNALTPPGSRVQSEHSYGTMRDSSPEPEHGGHPGGQLGDHLYSADKEDTAEDTETDTDPENNDVLEEENSANVRVDHQYHNSQERKSPRFRYVLIYICASSLSVISQLSNLTFSKGKYCQGLKSKENQIRVRQQR